MTKTIDRARQWLILLLRKRCHWQIVAYGALNAEGRELFVEACEIAYKQTKHVHPNYPRISPYVLAGYTKRFLGAWLTFERDGRLNNAIKDDQ
jgi:hypothetical protein